MVEDNRLHDETIRRSYPEFADIPYENKKARAVFGGKPRMLSAEEALEATGHPVGGICPFGLKTPLPVYCDVSLKAFSEVVPAAGSINSAVRISPARLAELTNAEWVDVSEIREQSEVA